jgi:hypothetical protein
MDAWSVVREGGLCTRQPSIHDNKVHEGIGRRFFALNVRSRARSLFWARMNLFRAERAPPPGGRAAVKQERCLHASRGGRTWPGEVRTVHTVRVFGRWADLMATAALGATPL